MDIEEEIRRLEEEIRTTQYNKATEKHIGLLKARIAKLKKEKEKKEKEKKKKKGKKGFRKSGDATITALADIFEPVQRVIFYRDARLQFVIFPRVEGDFSFINSSDLFLEKEDEEINVKTQKLKVKEINMEKIGELAPEIYRRLNLIRVFTKKVREKVAGPLTLKKGSTVKDVCEKIHKDLLKDFKFATIEGNSVKFKGQRVGLDHVLEDGDIITIYSR